MVDRRDQYFPAYSCSYAPCIEFAVLKPKNVHGPYRPVWACLRYRRRRPNDLSNSHAAKANRLPRGAVVRSRKCDRGTGNIFRETRLSERARYLEGAAMISDGQLRQRAKLL